MSDTDFRFYCSLFVRHLPLFLAIAISVFLVAACVAYMLPPTYRASAKILVEAPAIPADMARTTIPTNPIEQLQIIREKVSTRENLLALARKLKVYGDETIDENRLDVAENMRDRTSFELVKDPEQERDAGATIFRVSFDADNPVLAADVVNDLATFMLDKNARQRASRADDTSDFFQKESAKLMEDLTAIEARIVDFQKENKDTLPDGMQFRRSQQQNLQERLLQLGREAASLRSRRNALEQMRGANGALVATGPLTLEQQLLLDLKRQLLDQRTIFAEDSPNIVGLRARIADLERDAARNAEGRRSGAGTQMTSDVDLQLFDTNERLKSIEDESQALSTKLSELAKSIIATPATETALNALIRIRESLQGRLKDASTRAAEASTGRQLELLSKGERFSLIELAAPPLVPIKPNRARILALGAAAGLVLGLGCLLLLEIVKKTVRRSSDIEALLNVQPLAVIPVIKTSGELRLAVAKRGLATALAVASVPVLLFAVHTFYMPLHEILAPLLATIDRRHGV